MNQNQPNQMANRPLMPPQPPEPEYRFRWSIVAVVLAVLAFFWLRDGVDVSFQVQDVLDYLRIRHQDKYVQLACLGIVLIAVTLIAKTMRRDSK
jgi:Na+/H+ antiporter NhaC